MKVRLKIDFVTRKLKLVDTKSKIFSYVEARMLRGEVFNVIEYINEVGIIILRKPNSIEELNISLQEFNTLFEEVK